MSMGKTFIVFSIEWAANEHYSFGWDGHHFNMMRKFSKSIISNGSKKSFKELHVR
jgi:hypothetical protein